MKFGIRTPSLKKRIAARTSVKRYVRHNLGVKAPRGMGWMTNPKKAAYNRVYHRTSKGCGTSVLILMLLITVIILSTACTPQTVVIVVTATPEPTIPPTPTNTPQPPTPTPIPYELWMPDQVISAFQTADLEAVDPKVMTKDDYGAAPMSATTAIHFLIPSLCSDCGGRVFSFANQQDLEMVKNYYEELGKSSVLFYSWVFVKDNIVVQINGDLPEEKAKQYQDALNALN